MRLISLLLLVACSAPKEVERVLNPIGNQTSLEAFGAALADFTDGIDSPPLGPGRIRELYGPTGCAGHKGVNPGWSVTGTKSVAGQPIYLRAVTRLGMPGPADELCWMIASTRKLPAPIDFTPFGMPGCHLLVQPDHIIAIPHGFGGILWRNGGAVYFNWLPPSSAAGAVLYLQLLTASPSGFLASQGIEITVGSTQ